MKTGEKTEKHPRLPLFGEQITLFLGKSDSLRVEGVKRILTCTEEQVSLRLRGGSLHVFGKRLTCVTFSSGAVEITGEIERIGNERREAREDSHS